MTQCIIYAAKSTTDDAGSIPDQIAHCREYAAEKGWDVVAIESDEARSAYSESRGPGLVRAKEAAAAAARNGDAVLLAFTTDRFARGDAVEAAHLVEHVLEGLKAGYRVETAREDIGGEMALVLSALYGSRAHADSKAKSEHTKRGMAKAAAAGRTNGGPRRFGFEKADGSGTLTPRPEEMAVVELMFQMAHAGKSQSAIARELNAAGYRTARGHAWSQPQIGQVLRDRIWLGELVNMAGTFKVMEPLIDPELWNGVRRAFGRSGERCGRPSEKFLLVGGLLRCGSCGSSMRTRNEHYTDGTRKNYEHYSCAGRRYGSTLCKQGAVRREGIDGAVLAYFENVGLDIDATLAELTGERDRRLALIDGKLTQARKVVADGERQIERLDTMMRDEGQTLDEWRRLAAVPQREVEAAQLALADLTAERDAVESAVDAIDVAGDFLERITALRSTVAGEIVNAEGIAATRVALRRVFDGFVLHRADSPDAPRRVDADLAFGVKGYVLEPLVADDARLGVMPAGTPVLERVPLELEPSGSIKASSR